MPIWFGVDAQSPCRPPLRRRAHDDRSTRALRLPHICTGETYRVCVPRLPRSLSSPSGVEVVESLWYSHHILFIYDISDRDLLLRLLCRDGTRCTPLPLSHPRIRNRRPSIHSRVQLVRTPSSFCNRRRRREIRRIRRTRFALCNLRIGSRHMLYTFRRLLRRRRTRRTRQCSGSCTYSLVRSNKGFNA